MNWLGVGGLKGGVPPLVWVPCAVLQQHPQGGGLLYPCIRPMIRWG